MTTYKELEKHLNGLMRNASKEYYQAKAFEFICQQIDQLKANRSKGGN